MKEFWNFSQSVAEAKPATKATQVWLGHTNRTLFVFCEASEPETHLIEKTVNVHDGPVWTDDSFELFLDTECRRTNYFQFILSAAGVTADFSNGQKGWSPDYESAARIWSSSWTAEWAIPFETLGIA